MNDTTTTTTKPGVLAVMDAAISRYATGFVTETGMDLRAARDAVAKLIAAANYAYEAHNCPSSRGPKIDVRFTLSNSLRDALKGVGHAVD